MADISERTHEHTPRAYVWLSLILLLALALRLIRLGTHPYWQDEVHNLLQAEQLGKVLLTGDLASNHPPLPVILVAGWRALGLDANEWTMRMLPVTLGLLGLVAAFLVGRRLFGARTGLVVAFIMAIAPFHVYQSQELKEYILLPFTGALAVLALYEATERNTFRWWALYAVLAAISCYSDLFAGPLLVGVNLWFLMQLRGRGDRLRNWFLANVVGALLFVPQLGVMWRLTRATIIDLTAWWLPPPSLMRLAFYLKTLAFGYSDAKPWFKIALFLFCALALAGGLIAWRRDRRTALLLFCWFAVPIALVYGISMVTQSIFLIRSMIPYAVPFYLLIAVAVTRIPRFGMRAAMLALIAGVITPGLAARYKSDLPLLEFPHRPGVHPPQQFDKAAAFIRDHWQEGDIVVHPSGDPTFLPFIWYGLRGHPQYRVEVSEEFIRSFYAGNPITTTTHPDVKTYWIRQLQPLVKDRTRVWFVFSEWERVYLPQYPKGVWRWMDTHFAQIMHEDFQGFEVFLYATEPDGAPIEVVERDQDDGVSAQLTYAGSFAGRYQWMKPDAGLVPTPPEARRGRLTLRFDSGPDTAPHPLGRGPEFHNVTFALENHADDPVSCRVECVSSDYLIDAVSLYETDPDSEVWRVGNTYNLKPPPAEFDLPGAVGDVKRGPPASIYRFYNFAPGTYAIAIYLLGAPGEPAQDRAALWLRAGNQDILRPTSQYLLPMAWHWITGNPITIEGTDPVPIALAAFLPEDAKQAWANVNAFAFRRVPNLDTAAKAGEVLPAWPGDIALEPHTTQRWTAQVDIDAQRIDIWVYEFGEGGRGYRIFRGFQHIDLEFGPPL